jgi:thymidylate synthase
MVMNSEHQYLSLLRKILNCGYKKADRTGVGCRALFGEVIRHDFSDGFPLLTTKKMFTKGIITELLWFLKGTEDVSFLEENGNHIWDEWMITDKSGKKSLPHTYGVKWRNFYGNDQVANLINEIETNPDSRRHLVCAWDAANIKNAALPWCHVLWQIDIDKNDPPPGKKGRMSIAVYSRSVDMFLGFPFNLSSYAFLIHMIAAVTNYSPESLIYFLGNAHIYDNHIEQCKLQCSRDPMPFPILDLKVKKIDDYNLDDFVLKNYNSHPSIKGEVAV